MILIIECQILNFDIKGNQVYSVHISNTVYHFNKGPFNNYVDKMMGGGGQKMSVVVHAQGIKTVHAGGGGG